MDTDYIFISHASKDDNFVKELRLALEGQDITVWVDSRNLRGGDKLDAEIERAIENARQFIAVLSPDTINSPWVLKEIRKALEVEKQREDEGYRVIPLILPGVEHTALGLWFDEEPLAVPIALKPGGLSEALPAILAALGERLPDDKQRQKEVERQPVEELILELREPKMRTRKGERRGTATATLVYVPANAADREVDSKPFIFTAPLGPIEAGERRWYLESYHIWPVGVFKERAERIEEQLPKWGHDLYQAALGSKTAQETLNAWRNAAEGSERRFSVWVNRELPVGTAQKRQAAANEAASDLLSLPWELLHDDGDYLFKGNYAVQVRRRLPNLRKQRVRLTDLPIRILLISPRPEDEHTGYFDHRSSARPLVEAVESLGELVELTVLTPPTFPALEKALERAQDDKKPFDVVHFDGHGVYDPKLGLGALCFEDPKDAEKLRERSMQMIHAEKLAGVMRDRRIPLVFLEACQTAKAEEDPTASVAAKLLEEGVTSVVAMSHSVLVETARRFVQAFYEELARGKRVGNAMLAGQQKLIGDTYRGEIMGAGELRLQDWFVPVLYQEERDPQLFKAVPPQAVQQLQARQRKLSLGALPDSPPHSFIGRSRELLALERLLHDQRYAAVRGQGGAGKTVLAVELARWLVRTGRYERAAFVSMETYTDVRGVLDSLGHQLLPEEDKYSVAQYPDLKQAMQPVERALADHPTLIVLDNLESVLPDSSGETPPEAAPVGELFKLCQSLLDADPATRIVFTSREFLPLPFNHKRCEIGIGALSREDAIELVSQVMRREGLEPKSGDAGETPQEITDLVEAVNRHARALALLSQEISRRGVRATTENLHGLMAELDKKYGGDREKSLYASVELSLRRLSPEIRKQIKALAVFYGGVHMYVLDHVLGIDADDTDTIPNLFRQLINVGLGEDMGYNHLRLDPALPPYLLGEMDEAEREGMRKRWAEGMTGLTRFLYQQRSKDAEFAQQLALLELPNLLALLEWVQKRATPEEVANLAGRVEELIAILGRPRALAQAISVRETAAGELGEWSHARSEAECQSIERMLEHGDLSSAPAAAEELLKRCLDAGEDAYPGADYDVALAHFLLGRVLKFIGDAEAALEPLAQAQERFQSLADAGSTDAERMAFSAIGESADCMRDLGRLDEAATAYKKAIEGSEQVGDKRQEAVFKTQLGMVRILQRRYAEALEIYAQARDTFDALGEPGNVAGMWHQTGMVLKDARQYEGAERAYRQALAIFVQQKDRIHEAGSLDELGILYNLMGRLEEAVIFHQQAADIRFTLRDLNAEGKSRNNMAVVLIRLERYDQARRELFRAVQCKEPYGHAAQPWTTWDILHDVEQAVGNPQAAAEARGKAIASYLAYRRAGGESQTPGAQLCGLVAQAIQQRDTTEAEQILTRYSGADAEPWAQAMIPKLQAILKGDRYPALADDPDLDYRDAVELKLLLGDLRMRDA